MRITIILDSIPVEEQKAIFLTLKEKFENSSFEPTVSLDTFLDLNLWDFTDGLDKRVLRLLKENQIYSLRQIRSFKESDLRKIAGVGSRTVRIIEGLLKELNMDLASE